MELGKTISDAVAGRKIVSSEQLGRTTEKGTYYDDGHPYERAYEEVKNRTALADELNLSVEELQAPGIEAADEDIETYVSVEDVETLLDNQFKPDPVDGRYFEAQRDVVEEDGELYGKLTLTAGDIEKVRHRRGSHQTYPSKTWWKEPDGESHLFRGRTKVIDVEREEPDSQLVLIYDIL